MRVDIYPQNSVNLNISKMQKAVQSMIKEFLTLLAGGILFLGVIWCFGKPHRCTNLFLDWYGWLWQSPNRQGRAAIRAHRLLHEQQPVNVKMIAFARFLILHLENLLKELDYGRTYHTTTHLLSSFEKKARKKEIVLTKVKKTRVRYLFPEAMRLLGVKDFCKILFSKEQRYKLRKQFYKITFTRNR